MSNRLSRIAAALTGLLLSVLVLRSAAGYCVDPNFALLWAQLDDPARIPVYVAIGPETSVEHTGLTTAEVVRLTREVIARHNEAATGPTLVYAGLTASEMDYEGDEEADDTELVNAMFADRPFGITVDSYSCAYLHAYAPCGDNPFHRGCAKPARTHPKARITLVPAGCDPDFIPHTLTGNDLATVMLHELGHTLGLAHNQVDEDACEAGGTHLHGNASAGNEGVMHAQVGGNFPALREWRRDDLDGLAAVYGPPPATELVTWDDAMFPAAPALDELISLAAELRRPPAVSSASVGAPGEQFLVSTDADARVVVHARTAQGLSAPEIVDPSPSGRSWGNPGVALADTTLFVAWTAHEQPDDSRVALRWGVRPLAASSWTLAEIAAQPKSRVKRIAAGHAPGVDLFLLVSMTDYEALPRLLAIDHDAELLAQTELDGPTLFDVGNPACFADGDVARCVVPYSSNEFAGPKLGWLDLELDADGLIWVLDDAAGTVDASGKLGIASRPDLPRFRGAAGTQRYELEQLAGIGADDQATPIPPPQLDGRGWPIAVGSSWTETGTPRWWAYARRLVVCGDGLVQGFEQCDDGNLEPGDGCGPTCLTEHRQGGDLEPGFGTDDGLGADELGADCECRASSSSPRGAGLLLLALGFARRLSRRRRRFAAGPARTPRGSRWWCRGSDRAPRGC